MIEKGSDFSKLKLRYYAENYRGVHAMSNIKSGDTVLFVPLPLIITLEMAPVEVEVFLPVSGMTKEVALILTLRKLHESLKSGGHDSLRPFT